MSACNLEVCCEKTWVKLHKMYLRWEAEFECDMKYEKGNETEASTEQRRIMARAGGATTRAELQVI